MAGATRVTAAEIDPFAAAAIAANAALNEVEIAIVTDDLLFSSEPFWPIVAAGDVCYEQPMSAAVTEWLRRRARAGSHVLLADPGRAYRPDAGLAELARYNVPTTRELEDREVRDTIVWRVMALP
jgi:predicted nicotinamide N-methyase